MSNSSSIPKATTVHLRNAFDGLSSYYSDLTSLSDFDVSQTIQSAKFDSDPNTLMERYIRDRDIAHFQQADVSYGDFTGAGDFQSSLNAVIAAQSAFDALPAAIRSRFDNDPSKFVSALTADDISSDLRAEFTELGLFKPDLSPAASDRQVSGAAAGGKSSSADSSSVKGNSDPLKGGKGDD